MRALTYVVPAGQSYVDLAEGLSKCNRRLYRQGMQYAIQKIEFSYAAQVDAISSIHLTAGVAGDTWVVHNAWKKAFAHWTAQQRRARRMIGQSAQPTWEDFKIYLSDAHRAGTKLDVYAGDAAVVGGGEWDYSKFLWENDDASIEEAYGHIIGGDLGTVSDVGLILAYQQSRATVQPEDPDLPNEFSTNLYALMGADQDDVADEVAQNMEQENDEPPYDQNDYPGNDTNADASWIIETAAASVGMPNASLDGFVSQCGLLQFKNQGYDSAGNPAAAPSLGVTVHLAPGGYKGVAAIPMGQ